MLNILFWYMAIMACIGLCNSITSKASGNVRLVAFALSIPQIIFLIQVHKLL